MAKVNISVDTTEKTVEVTVDGSIIDNVSSAYVYADSPDYCGCFSLEISQFEKGENKGDLRKWTRLTAAKQTEKWAPVEKKVDHTALASLLLNRNIDE